LADLGWTDHLKSVFKCATRARHVVIFFEKI